MLKTSSRATIYCDCCPDGRHEGMAYLTGEGLVIVRKVGKERHTLTITLERLKRLVVMLEL